MFILLSKWLPLFSFHELLLQRNIYFYSSLLQGFDLDLHIKVLPFPLVTHLSEGGIQLDCQSKLIQYWPGKASHLKDVLHRGGGVTAISQYSKCEGPDDSGIWNENRPALGLWSRKSLLFLLQNRWHGSARSIKQVLWKTGNHSPGSAGTKWK